MIQYGFQNIGSLWVGCAIVCRDPDRNLPPRWCLGFSSALLTRTCSASANKSSQMQFSGWSRTDMTPQWCQGHKLSLSFPIALSTSTCSCLLNDDNSCRLPSWFLSPRLHFRQRKGGRGKEREHSFLLVSPHGSHIPHFHSFSIDQNLLVWPSVASREAEKGSFQLSNVVSR